MIRRFHKLRRRGNLRLKELGFAFADLLGIFPGKEQRLRKLILMYHGVVPCIPTKFNWRHVSTKTLRTQLKVLKKHTNVVSVRQLLDGHDLAIDRINVAITFDDGFRNNFDYALPILEDFKAPASIYITGANESGDMYLWPDFLDIVSRVVDRNVTIDGDVYRSDGKKLVDNRTGMPLSKRIKSDKPSYGFKQCVYQSLKPWADEVYRDDVRPYWELMSDQQIHDAAASEYIEIGCHGYYHNNLGEIVEADALDELRRCKRYLESIVEHNIIELAYPDGSYTASLVDAARRIGFEYQHCVEHRCGEPHNCETPASREGIYSFLPARTSLRAAVHSRS